MKDPLSGMAITGRRREAFTGEINIAEKNGHTIGPTTTTKMTSRGKVTTPTEEVQEDLSTMNITEA